MPGFKTQRPLRLVRLGLEDAVLLKAPSDAASGEQNRHRLSRSGSRRMNHVIHIAAVTWVRLDTEGRAPTNQRKRAEGKQPLEGMPCLKRRISNRSSDSCSPTPQRWPQRAREGTAERL